MSPSITAEKQENYAMAKRRKWKMKKKQTDNIYIKTDLGKVAC